MTRQLFDSLVEQDPETGELIAVAGRVVGDQRRRHRVHVPPPRRRHVLRRHAAHRRDRQGQLRRHHRHRRQGDVRDPALHRLRRAPTVVDAQTVTVTFTAAQRPVPAGGVDRRRSASSAPSTLALPFEDRATASLVGTGPFTLESYTKDTEVVLAKRPGYAWAPDARANDGEAHLDEIVFTIIPEASVRTGALQSGQVARHRRRPAAGHRRRCATPASTLVARANPGVVFGLSAVHVQAGRSQDERGAAGHRPGDRHRPTCATPPSAPSSPSPPACCRRRRRVRRLSDR